MATKLLTEKYADDLHGTLNSYDRVIITGHVQQWYYAQAMTSYLYQHEIRIFDYTEFAEPLRDSVRANAEIIDNSFKLFTLVSWKPLFRRSNPSTHLS